jgi:hypothetical protein
MFRYDGDTYDPPAVVAKVRVAGTASSSNVISDVPFLVDSGADVTVVPAACVTALGLQTIPDRFYEVEGYDGEAARYPMVEINLQFAGRSFDLRVLVQDRPDGILGRNILNLLTLLLDGPKLIWGLATVQSG